MPKRIQRRRTKGWRQPANCRYVGRGSRFGNLYDWRIFGRELSIRLYSDSIDGCWNPIGIPEHLIDHAYQIHCEMTRLRTQRGYYNVRSLRGLDVSCFCSLADNCHGDPILQRANA